MVDRIAKQKLNVILLVDTSKSMQGERIKQVNEAVRDIQDYLINLQNENSNVDFYLSIIQFSNNAAFYQGDREKNVVDLKFTDIKCGGWSNLHFGYQKLGELLLRESKGGIMSDFGGVAPIILLLSDGHPTTDAYKDELTKLSKLAWFKVALRYGIAIELHDSRSIQVLKDFVGENGDVIDCYDAAKLKDIIKIIVLTASKVRSTCTTINPQTSQNVVVKQQIAEQLEDTNSWEW